VQTTARVRSAILDLGLSAWLRGVARRRIGLAIARLRYPRAQLGDLCDLGPGVRLRIGATASVTVGDRCVIDEGTVIECRGRLSVGERTVIGHHCTIAVAEEVSIGSDCLLAELVSVRDHDHAFEHPDVRILAQGQRVAPVRIGRNVWLGAKVTVIRGVTIGDDTVVGANAVVTRDLPAGVVAAGTPARVVRTLERTVPQARDRSQTGPSGGHWA